MSSFIGGANSIQRDTKKRGKAPRKRMVHGKGEYTDHVWVWDNFHGGMTMRGIYNAAPNLSLSPIADTRVAVPNMNTRKIRPVTRKAVPFGGI